MGLSSGTARTVSRRRVVRGVRAARHSRESTTPGGGSGTAAPTTGETVEGGILRIGYTDPPDGINPFVGTNQVSYVIFQEMYPALVQYDADYKLTGDWAESWEQSPDGRQSRWRAESPVATAGQTAATQWLERTLDDSAPRRLVLPQAFLATDAQLVIYANIAGGLVVLPGGIRRNLEAHLPFLASEKILMAATTAGGDRQTLHEALRTHSHAATARIRDGHPNDLPQRLAADPLFQGVDIAAAMRPVEPAFAASEAGE